MPAGGDMQVIQLQNDFTTGEMDPKLRARNDIEQYKSGLAKATNVTVQPQGGARRRPGSKYIAALPGDASQGARCVSFEFSVATSYMLIFTTGRMYVFKDGALITNINASGNDYLAVASLTATIIEEMCWTQSYDTLIVVHEDLAPMKIFRGGADDVWTASSLTFDYRPKYAFTVSTSTPAASLTPSATTGNVTLTASAGVFSAGSVDQFVNSISSFGRARITEYISTTTVKARVTIPFFDTSAIASGNWEYETGWEDSWSAARGYPRTVVFYGGRLYFGGSKQRPSTVWGSKVGQYFDFNPGEALADEPVEATADTGQFNAITDMYSGRSLQIFTVGAEFFCPQPTDDPITPSTFFLKVQTQNGSRPGIRVANVEGGTIFLQRQGKALQEFIYKSEELAYTAAKISLLSSHLLKDPIEMCVRKATSTDEGDRLLIANGDDGTIACYTLLRSQKVIAPSEWITDGDYIAIGVDVDDAYAVVHRTIDGNEVYYVELFDEDTLLDCVKSATVGVSTASVSGLSFLEGETVSIIRDGVVEAQQAVASGAITFATAAEESYQIGLYFEPVIRTLPTAPKTAAGPMRAARKRIFDIIVDLYETQDLNVQGREVAFRAFSAPVLDDAVTEYTGLKRIDTFLGYERDAQIEITQQSPLKMTVLGIDYKVSV